MRSRRSREWSSFPGHKLQSAHRVALIVTTSFALAGLVWVLFSDIFLYTFTRDPVLVARIETAKGWTFIGLTSVLLYVVTLWGASRLIRAQAAISAIIDSIADGVLLLGPDQTIWHANPAAVRMLRCDGVHDLDGMGAPEFSRRFRLTYPNGALVPPDHYISQRVFHEGGPLHYKAIAHPLSGPEIVISVTAAALREKADEPAALVVSVMHDITDTEHLEQLRDQFFAAAAHSLKTPVAIIKTNVQLLSRGAPPEFRRSTVAIERQCDRIDRLVQNLFVIARVRSRTLQLHPGEVNLAPLVDQIAREFVSASVPHDVRTEMACSPRVYADPERLLMALRNVVDEAVRTSPSGSPLTLMLRRQNGDAEIGVRYRGSAVEARSCEGYEEYDELGISRCVATTIVEAHGGTLRDETTGNDTTTWIRLPASEDRPAGA
jgi:signal transduction histidine kinase